MSESAARGAGGFVPPLPPVAGGGSAFRTALSTDRAPFLLLASYGILWAVWVLTSTLPEDARGYRSDLAFLPVGLLVCVLAWSASRAAALDPGTRRAWRFLTASFFVFWIGDALWYVSQWIMRETGTTGAVYVASQTAYIVYYPLMLMGLLSFPRFLHTRAEARQFWLDVATVFLGGLMLLWSALIAPIAGGGLEPGRRGDDDRVPVGRPHPPVRHVRHRGPPPRGYGRGLPFYLLTAGLMMTVVNDSISSVLSLTSGYRSGSTLDLIAMAAWLFFGASAEAQRRLGRGRELERDDAGHDSMSLAPYVAVVLGYGTLFVSALADAPPSVPILLGAIALTAAVLVRQYSAISENVRLSAESAARASEARFRSLVQNSSDIIAVVSPEAEIRYQTPSVERLLGYRPELLDGTRFTDLLHPEDQPRAVAILAEAPGHGGTPAPIEWRLRRRDRRMVLRRGDRHEPHRGPDDRRPRADDSRHPGTQGTRKSADPPGFPRSSHQARQPGALVGPRRARAGPQPARRPALLGPAPRSRRLQGHQRHLRPRLRRRGPDGGRASHPGLHPRRRHRRAAGWRRVRAAARRHPRRRRPHARSRIGSHAALRVPSCSAGRSSSSRPPRASPSACPATPKASCCATPTSPSTWPRRRARAASRSSSRACARP